MENLIKYLSGKKYYALCVVVTFIATLILFCRPAPGYPPGPDVVVSQSHFTVTNIMQGSPLDTNYYGPLIDELNGWRAGTFAGIQTNDIVNVTYYHAWGKLKINLPETRDFISIGINSMGQIGGGYGFALHSHNFLVPDYIMAQGWINPNINVLSNASISVSVVYGL